MTPVVVGICVLIAGICVGFAYGRLTDRPRDPITDAEHADRVHAAARSFNIALHNARAAGLNPAIIWSPIDVDRPPGERPVRATVERYGEAIPRTGATGPAGPTQGPTGPTGPTGPELT